VRVIRDATPADFADIVRLNAETEHFTSPMDAARLAELAGQAAYLRVAAEGSEVAAFLLGFREGSAYTSPNYRWFADRYPRFLYIDRVVVGASHRRHGWGRRLYEDLFAFARDHAVEDVTCEFDIEPPNPVSLAFHAGFGFAEVGQQRYGVRNKLVSLQRARSTTT
jgi:predicted GNAT superfamily acetyltransferase